MPPRLPEACGTGRGRNGCTRKGRAGGSARIAWGPCGGKAFFWHVRGCIRGEADPGRLEGTSGLDFPGLAMGQALVALRKGRSGAEMAPRHMLAKKVDWVPAHSTIEASGRNLHFLRCNADQRQPDCKQSDFRRRQEMRSPAISARLPGGLGAVNAGH